MQASGKEVITSGNYLSRNELSASDYARIGAVPGGIRSADAVSIFFMRPDRLLLRRLDDYSLKRSGCEYKVEGSMRLDRLAAIIDGAEMRPGAYSEDEFEPRILIYANNRFGGRDLLSLGKVYSTDSSVIGKVGNIKVLANRMVLPALYEYMASLPPVDGCEDYVAKYRK